MARAWKRVCELGLIGANEFTQLQASFKNQDKTQAMECELVDVAHATVAILAQGTSWAVAVTQALFCCAKAPAPTSDDSTLLQGRVHISRAHVGQEQSYSRPLKY